VIVIHKPRQEGKTTELIATAVKDQLTLVLLNRSEVMRVIAICKENNWTIPLPVTHNDFLCKRIDRRTKGLLIDNADMLLKAMSMYPIEAISLTNTQGVVHGTVIELEGNPDRIAYNTTNIQS
jgi:hypothetical protein